MGLTLFEARGVYKRFPGVLALAGVDFRVRAGEVHGLIGMNGAGKSTLVKIISGAYAPDKGEMTFEGRRYAPHTPADAIRTGVAVVYQERTLVPFLTVAQNLVLGREHTRFGLLDEAAATRQTQSLIEQLDLPFRPSIPVRRLGEGERQLVDLMRVLSHRARLIILDEPTAALTPEETERLFNVVQRLRDQGIGIIFTSHRLDEVLAICDRLTILRDGQVVYTGSPSARSRREIIDLMLGRELTERDVRQQHTAVAPALSVQHFSGEGFYDVCLAVGKGEIVGLAGLVGSGCTALLETLAGARRPRQGTMILAGRSVLFRSPRAAIKQRVVLLPEKRSEKGLIERLTIRDNLVLPSLQTFCSFGFVRRSREQQAATGMMRQLRITAPHTEFSVRNLSGGNKQKVVFGKWLLALHATDGAVFLLDEPTEGVDVGAKVEMWTMIQDLATRGAAILIASSDLDELLQLCDRIYVLRRGRIVNQFQRGAATQADLLHAMALESDVEPQSTKTGAMGAEG